MSIVGLSGGFGTVKLGRHDTSFDDIRDLTVSSNLWDSEFSADQDRLHRRCGRLLQPRQQSDPL